MSSLPYFFLPIRQTTPIKALSQLENDIVQAWVQRDTQTLDRILAGDYTFAGAGDVLIDKERLWQGCGRRTPKGKRASREFEISRARARSIWPVRHRVLHWLRNR